MQEWFRYKAIAFALLSAFALCDPLFSKTINLGTYSDIAGFDATEVNCNIAGGNTSDFVLACSASSGSVSEQWIILSFSESREDVTTLISTGDVIELDDGFEYEVLGVEATSVTSRGTILGRILLKRPGFPSKQAVWLSSANGQSTLGTLEVPIVEGDTLDVGGEQVLIEDILGIQRIGERVKINGNFSPSNATKQSPIYDPETGQIIWFPLGFYQGLPDDYGTGYVPINLGHLNFGPIYYRMSDSDGVGFGFGWPGRQSTIDIFPEYGDIDISVPDILNYSEFNRLPRYFATNESWENVAAILEPIPSETWQWEWRKIHVPRGLVLNHSNGRTLHLDCVDWESASITHYSSQAILIQGKPCIDGTTDQADALIFYDGASFKPIVAQYDLIDLSGDGGLSEVEQISPREVLNGRLYIGIKVLSAFPTVFEVVSFDICSGDVSPVDAETPWEFSTPSIKDDGERIAVEFLDDDKRCLSRDFMFGDSFIRRN
jgi:hypothetical protein